MNFGSIFHVSKNFQSVNKKKMLPAFKIYEPNQFGLQFGIFLTLATIKVVCEP